jgi:hypothetical protein
MGYWQVSAGYGGERRGGRDYSDVFLDFGVMLTGPGEYGEYFENAHRYKQEKDGRRVERFAEELEIDDVVVLKRPAGRQWEVRAVGVVKSTYVFLPVFDDVEGWDIQHGRRVEWVVPTGGQKPMSGFTQGTLNKVKPSETRQAIDTILSAENPIVSNPLPPTAGRLNNQDLIDNLIDNGMRAEDADHFIQAVKKIRELGEWYRELVRQGVKVKEHEPRTFLIVPLLLALGWTEQRLKIEWNNIDVAFFESPYNYKNNDPIMLLESKKLLESLGRGAIEQVLRYATKYPRCKRLVVSDGCSYKVFERQDGNWNYSAYLNILKPRSSHPYKGGINGASDVLLDLMVR